MATGNDEVCDMLSNALILARIAEVPMTEAVEAGDKIEGQLEIWRMFRKICMRLLVIRLVDISAIYHY